MANAVFSGSKHRNDVISQTVRNGRFVKWILETHIFTLSYAQRPSNSAFCHHRHQVNSVAANGTSEAFLQQTAALLIDSTFDPGPSSHQRPSLRAESVTF